MKRLFPLLVLLLLPLPTSAQQRIGDFTKIYLGGTTPGSGTTQLLTGTGTPEGAVTAAVGSMYFRTDGSTGTTCYVKESGTGNTGWHVCGGSGGASPSALLDGGTVHTDTTNSVVTKGDLVCGNATPAWDDLAVGTNGQALVADSTQPCGIKWSAVGTGSVTHTAGSLTANRVVIGNAVDDIAVLSSLGTTTTLLHGNAGGAPTFGAVVFGDWSQNGCATNEIPKWNGTAWACSTDASAAGSTNALLDGSNHTDTTNSPVTKGDLIVGNATPAWDDLAVGTDGDVLTVDSAQTLGVKWAAPAAAGGEAVVVKPSDENVISSTTLQDDNDLVIPVTTSSTYFFQCNLLMASDPTADFKLHFTVPTSTTLKWGFNTQGGTSGIQWDAIATGGTGQQSAYTESSTVNIGSNNSGGASNFFTVYFAGWAFTAGTAGNVTLQWAQFASVAVNNTLYKGSFCRTRKLI